VQRIYLPNCLYVGPNHKIFAVLPKVVVRDRDDYPTREVSDDEFVALRKAAQRA
jgi:hypothetical protein